MELRAPKVSVDFAFSLPLYTSFFTLHICLEAYVPSYQPASLAQATPKTPSGDPSTNR